jgi:enamine deaminase RidA (YjgF/YER057c/UK114 family)
MAPPHHFVRPEGWPRPKGYANGVVAEGKLLFVAGQVGWDPRNETPTFPSSFAAQFDQALANVVEVVRAAGGEPSQLTRLILYVVDKKEYVAALKEVGESWRRHLGRHYPAMVMVQVTALLEDAAKVEIEGTAVL